MNEREEVYDWMSTRDVDVRKAVEVERIERSSSALVNPVNGHGQGCLCPQCPGWYDNRMQLLTRSPVDVVPPARRPNVLVDQVVPVAALMAMVTVCGLVLLPVVVPLLAVSAMMVVALAIVVVAGAAAVVYAVNAIKRTERGGWWRR